MDDISFVQEGSFVETGGNPALKIVGQVQTVIGAQRVVVEKERNKAINADEIINSFITQEEVNNPLEFVKQICYQNTGNMPIYYYLSLAKVNTDEAISYIEGVPVNSISKDLLKRRISQKEVKYTHIANTNTSSSKKKKMYLQSIIEESLIIPNSDAELKYCLSAIRGINREQIIAHKEYILNIMYEVYTNYFNSRSFSSIKPEFRYSLCWIDESLFMEW